MAREYTRVEESAGPVHQGCFGPVPRLGLGFDPELGERRPRTNNGPSHPALEEGENVRP